MSDDERDFILLCDSILDDGEVSAEEAYGIAEWLNDHREIAQSWPANQLIKPLQDIWADGSVNRRELHRLARLLISIQRECAAQSPESSSFAAERPLPALTSAVTAGEARLPNLSAKMQIPSSTELGVLYDVDLNGPTCSCPDWRGRRSRLPIGHLSRCCKHILDAYAQLPRASEVDDWLHCFIDTGWPASPKTEWKLLTVDGEKVLLSTAANKGWANAFAKEDSGYTRFGYNLEEGRWAYGSEPEFGSIIADAIRSLTRTTRHRSFSDVESRRNIERGRSKSMGFVFNRWLIAVFVLLLIALVVALNQGEPNGKTGTRIGPPQGKVPVATPWTAKTIREVRVKDAGRSILIPRGAQLRVIARSGNEILVSYNGSSLTIPASATDLR